ncbi:DDRGK domain-containing protein 1 [Mustela nigripes]|uniref:DDRGK domain-containing protein 1 n=1 Tax=Mustela nigripes TaxID=77151 RepID=UPI0028165439|nr:DDRGK domain-containing protein 1 [Mustela nigripes]
MVAPVVYLVAAALLVGLIFFLTHSRGRTTAAGQEPLHNEELPVVAGSVAQPQPLEPEEQRTGGRPRRRRDLGSRLQAQRRAQHVTWAEVDENEEEAIIPGEKERARLYVLVPCGGSRAQNRDGVGTSPNIPTSCPQEEEERKAREEQAQREHEEYLKLKESFVVEEEGVGETMTEEQSHSFLTEFINYIKQSKVVLLEDLASQVGLRTQDTINRIQDLLAEGTLTGVIDDRGKFIYITPEELAAVANFIRQRGRVSITELAQASNSLIAWGREPPVQSPA